MKNSPFFANKTCSDFGIGVRLGIKTNFLHCVAAIPSSKTVASHLAAAATAAVALSRGGAVLAIDFQSHVIELVLAL